MSTKKIGRLVLTGAVALTTALSGVALASAPAAAAVAPRCTASQLTGRFVGPHEGAAGTIYTDLRLTNRSVRACTLQGVPTGRFLHHGDLVGARSRYNPYPSHDGRIHLSTVRLAPRGGRAFILVGIAEAGNYGQGCHPLKATALRVTLPRSVQRVRVPFGSYDVQVCANTKDRQLTLSRILANRTTDT